METAMSGAPQFKAAFAYQGDVLALPVTDIDAAARWYCEHFGMVEIDRPAQAPPTVILERDGVRVGFAVNGGDASQNGAAILVSGITGIRNQIAASGIKIGNWRVDEQDDRKLQVFFVVAPDGLCYYFHEPIA
jgi:catechol 2,3-dioxygenase-like lactoylglutathione lyase family enzyme